MGFICFLISIITSAAIYLFILIFHFGVGMNTSPASHHTNRLKRRQNISHEEYPLVPPHLMKELQATSAKALDKCRAAVAEAQKKVLTVRQCILILSCGSRFRFGRHTSSAQVERTYCITITTETPFEIIRLIRTRRGTVISRLRMTRRCTRYDRFHRRRVCMCSREVRTTPAHL